MSHLLTRLVDRVYGNAPTVEPVRTPLFNDASPAQGETPPQQWSEFTYSDLTRSQQGLPHPIPNDPEGRSNAVVRHEEGVAMPMTPAQSLRKGEMDTLDKSVVVTPEVITHRLEHNIAVPPANVGPHSERVVEAGKTHTTELSPVAAHRQLTGENQASQSVQDQYSIDTNRFLPDYPPVKSTATAQNIAATKSQGDWEQYTSPTQGPLLQPLVTARPSVIHHQQVTNDLPRQRDKSTSLPTIRVTIGRIDVRAVSAPQTPAAQKPGKRPQPSLSLDDYLKQRNGGQR
jgi:hypothetical protein